MYVASYILLTFYVIFKLEFPFYLRHSSILCVCVCVCMCVCVCVCAHTCVCICIYILYTYIPSVFAISVNIGSPLSSIASMNPFSFKLTPFERLGMIAVSSRYIILSRCICLISILSFSSNVMTSLAYSFPTIEPIGRLVRLS